MTEINAETFDDPPIFVAELVPHRSLGVKGWRIFMLLAGVLSAAHVMVFLISGAWPVAIFFGLDFALLFGAFWLNNRAALAREEVSVSRTRLKVSKIQPSGKRHDVDFNPFFTRFNVKRHTDIGITSMQIASGRRQTEVGAFLPLDDKESFAKSMTRALATVKRRI